jgi:uncharacterized membrane protein
MTRPGRGGAAKATRTSAGVRAAPTASDAPHGAQARLGAAAVTAFAFALLGLAVSVYLTIEHFTSSVTLACPETATINCAKVTTSAWSHIGGIPVAVLGLAYFTVMAVLTSPPAMRARRLDRLRVAAAGAGVAMVLYLLWVELFRVDAICLWCTAVHICTVAMFGAVLWQTVDREPSQL